jgi:hypothetical protein
VRPSRCRLVRGSATKPSVAATTTTCVDSRNQSGFVISPAGSFILNESNPLLDRPEGTNPFIN